MLKLQNLTACVNGKTILHGIDVAFEPGKVYALLGPNGSGKSTLAYCIAGHPRYEIETNSVLSLNGQDISALPAHERAHQGIFLSFQTPLTLPGITVGELLRLAVGDRMKALELRQTIAQYADELDIKNELLKRSLNEGFSGGEKKKLEVLQAVILKPKVLLLDEIDTGVDVDSLQKIGAFLAKHRNPEQTFVIISHSAKLFEHLVPDETIVLQDGKIARTGDGSLALDIAKTGFGNNSTTS